MATTYNDRRKFPVVAAVMNVAFIMAIAGLTFWVSIIDARLRTVTSLQTSVLESNIKFGEQCKGIKLELNRINKQLNDFLPHLLNHDRHTDNK